jgi:hypothetical protein
VAGTEEEAQETEHWTTERLKAHLESILPMSITVEVQGIPQPITLVRGISSPGVRFCFITYWIPGQDMGPRVTAMTTQQEFDKDAILADIAQQAGAMYRNEKKRVEPRLGAAPPIPTEADIARLAINGDSVNGDDAMKAREDAAVWAANRSQRWR